MCVKKGYEDRVREVFEKWDLHCEIIGEVTNDDNAALLIIKGKLEAELPPFDLVLGGGAPVYIREQKEPSYIKEKRKFDFKTLPEPKDLKETFLKVFSSPNIASKRWVYRTIRFDGKNKYNCWSWL